jgi:predicted RNase H-like HicB family nuclease
MMVNRYPFHIEWSDEDEEFIATCPAFPGLSAFGKTEEKALKEAKVALAGFVETYKANNLALPEPTIHKRVSGKFQLRLPKSLHSLAVLMAHREGVSLNSYIADAVRAKVAGDQVGNRVLNEVRQLIAKTTHRRTVRNGGTNASAK